ncbi:hypothetical protein PRIPAC_92584 [Pristionchus pacificus]|nr:hypothetical protein PRIPAC_92584 [Pristionchus pacificus]
MASVALLRAGYEKRLRDEHKRRAEAEEQWRRTDAERTQLLREREALRRILLGVTVGKRTCERHARSGRSRSVDSRPRARTLQGRVQQLREEISSQRRLLAELEGELMRRDEAIAGLEEETLSARERERVLVERLQEAVELSDGGVETERILRAELDYAQSRLAAVSPSRVQQAAAAAAAADNLAFDVAANEGVLQRLQEVESLLAENERREEAQTRLLEEMGEQISLVISERDEAIARARRFETKYQKAKADVGAWMEAVERLTDCADAPGRLVDGRSGLQRARELHAEADAEMERERRERREMDDAATCSQLLRMVEDERAIARSLHEDLDATRKMLLDRDAEVHELAAQLSEARVSLSAEYTRAELERGRADETAAASHADTTAYAGALDDSIQENGALRARLADTLKQCASYAAKLEAQGRDLIAVKKELQRLQLQQP